MALDARKNWLISLIFATSQSTMLSLIALTLTITAHPAPLADPLRMSSRDLMKQRAIERKEHRHVGTSCTDALGATYASTDSQYTVCMKAQPQDLKPAQVEVTKSKSFKIKY